MSSQQDAPSAPVIYYAQPASSSGGIPMATAPVQEHPSIQTASDSHSPQYSPPIPLGSVNHSSPGYAVLSPGQPASDACALDDMDLEHQPYNGGARYKGSHPDEAVKLFIRKVYSILFGQIICTIFLCCVCMYNATVREYTIMHSSAIFWSSFVLSLVCLIALMFLKKAAPANFLLMTMFTLSESWFIGVLCAYYYEAGAGEILLQAWILTGTLFFALTIFTFQSKFNFQFLGAYLFGAAMILVVWGFLGIWLGFPTGVAYSLIGALTFCGYIVYDTWRLTKTNGFDDPILASIELYLDFINLFLYLLSLLKRSGSS